MKRRTMSGCVYAVGLAALLGLGVYSVHEAKAACSIYYVSAITEWQSEPFGSFGPMQSPQPQVDVTWTSQGQAPWLLYAAPTPGNSVNVTNLGVTPTTREITAAEESYPGAGDKFFTISGLLLSTGSDGLYQLSNWDGTSWQCAGAHNVTILKP